MNILYKYTIPEALMISGHTIEARRRPPRNCFTACRLHYQWRCLYHVCTTCTQPVVNTTDKTAAVTYAAVAVPVGTTPVISAMITTVIVYNRPRRHGCGDRNSERWHDHPDSHCRRQALVPNAKFVRLPC